MDRVRSWAAADELLEAERALRSAQESLQRGERGARERYRKALASMEAAQKFATWVRKSEERSDRRESARALLTLLLSGARSFSRRVTGY